MNPFEQDRILLNKIKDEVYNEIEPEYLSFLGKTGNITDVDTSISEWESKWQSLVMERFISERAIIDTSSSDSDWSEVSDSKPKVHLKISRKQQSPPEGWHGFGGSWGAGPAPTEGVTETLMSDETLYAISSDDDDDLPYEFPDDEEFKIIFPKSNPDSLKLAISDIKLLTRKWSIRDWEYNTEQVVADLKSSNFSEETLRKKFYRMWCVAKAKGLCCEEQFRKLKEEANYVVMTNRSLGISTGKISKLQYGEIVSKMIKQNIDLNSKTLFLVGLPARRVADVEALWVVDSPASANDTRRNYLIRDPTKPENSKFEWRIQKTNRVSDYVVSDFDFLDNYKEILEVIQKLPFGKYSSDKYYKTVVDETGWIPNNFRHLCFTISKKYNQEQYIKIVRAMNSSMDQANCYCV